MTNDDPYADIADRINATDGFEIQLREDVGIDLHVLDFSIDWPDESPAEKHPLRYGAVERSAVILKDETTADEWELRLAPIDATDNGPKEDVESRLKVSFEQVVDYPLWVRLASDGDTWTPHVHPERGGPRNRPVDDVLADIRSIWDRYRDIVLDDPFGVVVPP